MKRGRIYRGLSGVDWDRAANGAYGEQHPERTYDAAFIFYWIAFNAIYAEDRPEDEDKPERRIFDRYFQKIVKLDSDNAIYDALSRKAEQVLPGNPCLSRQPVRLPALLEAPQRRGGLRRLGGHV